jgi:methylated-DNA-[protein]-cysteine S-methyltransferase
MATLEARADLVVAYHEVDSPVGPLWLESDGERLTGLHFGRPRLVLGEADREPFAEVVRQLAAYFAAELKQFDLPLRLEGTPFQKGVWAALCKIPYGQTISYGELARRVGSPGAFRAVGSANGRNPVAIIVPCHRVINTGGGLGGFGGGLEVKKQLLGLERRTDASLFL